MGLVPAVIACHSNTDTSTRVRVDASTFQIKARKRCCGRRFRLARGFGGLKLFAKSSRAVTMSEACFSTQSSDANENPICKGGLSKSKAASVEEDWG